MITIILMIIVVVVIIAKFVVSRYFEEWREMDVDNLKDETLWLLQVQAHDSTF